MYGYDKTPTPAIDYDVSKVPPEIKKRTTWVKTKYTGEDVAEAYGQVGDIVGIYAGEAKQLAERTQIRQDAVEDFNNQVIQEMTDKDVISAPEIIQMRDNEATAGERLNRDFGKLDDKIERFKTYKNVLFYGVKNDGTDTEDALNALPEGGTYVFPAGTYAVRGFDPTYPAGVEQGGFRIKSNTRYIFEEGAVIKVIPNDSWRYNAIFIHQAYNFELVHPQIEGDRYEHDYTDTSGGSNFQMGTHELGRGIFVWNEAIGFIYNPRISNCTGDGIDIISHTPDKCDIKIFDVDIDSNRRNGIAVESCGDVVIERGTVTNTNGASPEFGIDIEPYADYQMANNIKIKDVKTKGNVNGGINFYGLQYFTEYNIEIDDCEFEDGVQFKNSGLNSSGKIKMRNPKIGGYGIRNLNAAPSAEIYDAEIYVELPSGSPAIDIQRTATSYACGYMTMYRTKFLNDEASGIIPMKLDASTMTSAQRSIYYVKLLDTALNNTKKYTEYGALTNHNQNHIDQMPNTSVTSYGDGFLLGKKVTNKGHEVARHILSTNIYNRNVNGTIVIESESNYPLSFDLGGKIYPFDKQHLSSSKKGSKLVLRYSPTDGLPSWVAEEVVGEWS